MKEKKNYQPYSKLDAKQRKQVADYMLSQKCKYYERTGMKYNLDCNGDFTREYIDPYFFALIS